MLHRESIEWCDSWVAGADDDRLPRVLLVGDSIARSYYATVQEALAGKYLCARLTTSRSICDPAFNRELTLLLDEYRFAVIHLNNGLHGWDYDEATYGRSLPRILDFISEKAPQSRLVWAHSTPVWEPADTVAALADRTSRVRARNEIARMAAAGRKLPVNDLFSLVIDHPEYVSADGVHFNAAGQRVLGEQVARVIVDHAPGCRTGC